VRAARPAVLGLLVALGLAGCARTAPAETAWSAGARAPAAFRPLPDRPPLELPASEASIAGYARRNGADYGRWRSDGSPVPAAGSPCAGRGTPAAWLAFKPAPRGLIRYWPRYLAWRAADGRIDCLGKAFGYTGP